jgi:hypothetical protein
MGNVLWDCEGFLLLVFLSRKITLNSEKYCETLEELPKAVK